MVKRKSAALPPRRCPVPHRNSTSNIEKRSRTMKQRFLTALFLSAILALTALGCSGATPAVDAPQEASEKPHTADANPPEIEAVTAEQLADCLATMFPQMNHDELERQAQMQMTDASSVENAEAFVERVCGACLWGRTDTCAGSAHRWCSYCFTRHARERNFYGARAGAWVGSDTSRDGRILSGDD